MAWKYNNAWKSVIRLLPALRLGVSTDTVADCYALCLLLQLDWTEAVHEANPPPTSNATVTQQPQPTENPARPQSEAAQSGSDLPVTEAKLGEAGVGVSQVVQVAGQSLDVAGGENLLEGGAGEEKKESAGSVNEELSELTESSGDADVQPAKLLGFLEKSESSLGSTAARQALSAARPGPGDSLEQILT